MAGLVLDMNSGDVTLVANTELSALQIKAPSNQRLLIREIAIQGKQAAGGTDAVVEVRATRSTSNFGTFTSVTPGKRNPSDGETIQGTYGKNASVEPTTPTDTGWARRVQPELGTIEYLPLTRPIEVPGGQSVQIELKSTGTPTLLVQAAVEE